jgi:hypothetical protein
MWKTLYPAQLHANSIGQRMIAFGAGPLTHRRVDSPVFPVLQTFGSLLFLASSGFSGFFSGFSFFRFFLSVLK